jgi:hypothetical protein
MILEVVHPSGARTWHPIGERPITVGRAFSNDLILDDPYADARHARISVAESGVTVIEDLGSTNGLVSNYSKLMGRVQVLPGTEVRLGRTMLRFRDTDEPVAPALVDAAIAIGASRPAPAMDHRRRPRRSRAGRLVARWSATTGGRLAVAGLAASAIALYSWLGSSERSSSSEALFAALAFAAMVALWAGIWSVASRVSVQRFHFLGHVAVASLVALGGLVWTMVAEWLTFFFPDASLADFLSVVIGLFLLTALVAGHLALASALTRRRQWRVGFVVAGAALIIGGLATLAEEEGFSDIPSFSGVVKPVASDWLPTTTVEEFGDVMATLKDEVDEMATR